MPWCCPSRGSLPNYILCISPFFPCFAATSDHTVRASSCLDLQEEGAILSGYYVIDLPVLNETTVYCKQSMSHKFPSYKYMHILLILTEEHVAVAKVSG